MPRRTATLEDVARAAGVSQQTVSRVLNRPEVVSARTREQVIRAMQALHYVPNRSAQLLAGKAAPSIGLITASLTLHAPSQIAAAIKSHASLHQLEVAIAMPAQADFVALQARLDELRAQHIRGVIVSLPLESATAERLVQDNPDMACLFLDVSPEADVCCVRFDHRDGCGACVRHLWELGQRIWSAGGTGKFGFRPSASRQLARGVAQSEYCPLYYGVWRLERRQRLAENFRAPPPAAADQRHSGGKRSDGARRAQRAGPAQSQRQPGGIGDRLR